MTLIMIDGFVNVPLCGFAWLCVPLCGPACSMIKRLKRFRQLCKRNPHTPDLVNGWLGDIVWTKVKVNICNNKNNAFLLPLG